MRAELAERIAALAALQGVEPMVPLQVDGHVVAEIVAAWTGIPLGRMVKDEIETVMNLNALLGARVIGQDHALDAVAQRVRTATAGLEDPNKPRGVFMFVGPSGVGKTETALALADVLYGGERKMVTINMSEYQEAHSVSGLKGSPPGYVGYGEGGVLTEAVRRNPYSVVLLDEVEKAHPDVLEMFFQVFDKGAMDDAEGREIDFRNTLIILTSNVGSSQVMQACLNKPEEELPDPDALAETLRPALYKAFKPAFLGRMKVVPYYPISDEVLVEIIELKLDRIRRRIEANHKAAFEWDESLVEAVLARCTEVDSAPATSTTSSMARCCPRSPATCWSGSLTAPRSSASRCAPARPANSSTRWSKLSFVARGWARRIEPAARARVSRSIPAVPRARRRRFPSRFE